jgi:hypothetical protein
VGIDCKHWERDCKLPAAIQAGGKYKKKADSAATTETTLAIRSDSASTNSASTSSANSTSLVAYQQPQSLSPRILELAMSIDHLQRAQPLAFEQFANMARAAAAAQDS